ncbi:MAG: helix-turn-helix domain-containing protein [Pseudomonadaceae bacterium]
MANSTHNSDYQLLLNVLRAVRKRVGVSQVDLAERLGNTQTFVSKCERGERRLDVVELVELFAEALGVSPLELIEEFLEKRCAGASPKTRKAPRQSA